MSSENDVLFGVLGAQLGLVSAVEIVRARTMVQAGRSNSIGNALVDSGHLTLQQRNMVNAMAVRALETNAGNTRAVLDNFGGDGALMHTFAGAVKVSATGAVTNQQPEEAGFVTLEHPGRYGYPTDVVNPELGRGAIGRVLLMKDEHLGRKVALKELLHERSGGGSRMGGSQQRTLAATRFLREARITGQLEHPNIVPVYELGCRPDGTLYYTMKVVQGRTFSDALEECNDLEGRLQLLKHFADACDGMAYAHSHNVVHRDIKPDNIMLGQFGETLVLDWGLAKSVGQNDLRADELADQAVALRDGDGTETVAGALLGTPLYMSPEQARGDIDNIDARSDVWSLGAVLYEMLTGIPPYKAKSSMQVIIKTVSENLIPVCERAPDAPPELVYICEKALARDRMERYATAGELTEDIRAYLTGGRIRAYQYSMAALAKRFFAQHRASITIGLISLFLLVGGGIYSYLEVVGQRDRAVVAESSAKSARDDAEELIRYMVVDLKERLQPLGRIDLLEGVMARVDQYYAASANVESDGERKRSRAAAFGLVAELRHLHGKVEKALAANEHAIALRQELHDANPKDRVIARELSTSYLDRAQVQIDRGHSSAAKSSVDRASALLGAFEEEPVSYPKHLLEASRALIMDGQLAEIGGGLEKAAKVYTQAIDKRRKLHAAHRDNARYHLRLASALDRAGFVYHERNELEEAGKKYQESLEIRRGIVSKHPTNLGWVHQVASSYTRLGDVRMDQNQIREAFKTYQEALKRLEQVSEENPSNLAWRRDVASGHRRMGDIAVSNGNAKLGAVHFESAIHMLEQLVESDKANAEWRRDLGLMQNRLGEMLMAEGKTRSARKSYEKAMVQSKALIELDPKNAIWRHDLAVNYLSIGNVSMQMGDMADARSALKTALEALTELTKKDPTNASFKRDMVLGKQLLDSMENETSSGDQKAPTTARPAAPRGVRPIRARRPAPAAPKSKKSIQKTRTSRPRTRSRRAVDIEF